ncbi:MAG: DUF4166 domain-containing protein [Polyangiaceae bacterium]
MSFAAAIEHPAPPASPPGRRRPSRAAMRLHQPEARLHGLGVFRVTRARGRLAHLLGRCLRLPTQADAVEAELLVERTADGARWARRFGDRWLITTQRFGDAGELVERFGPVELTFRLLGYGDWLVFLQVRAAIHVGPFRLPLPAWAAPHVAGRVRCSPVLDRLEARIRLRAPLFGELVRYGGSMVVQLEKRT